MASRLDGRFELSIYLQNSNPDEPFYVLEPTRRILVQIDRSWQPVPVTPVEGSANTVHAITSKQVFPLTFRADFDRCDELIKGYMHMRISNVMFISENPEPTGNLFERNDDYYFYLKPQELSEDEVRRRNGWKEGALVSRWIAMPAH